MTASQVPCDFHRDHPGQPGLCRTRKDAQSYYPGALPGQRCNEVPVTTDLGLKAPRDRLEYAAMLAASHCLYDLARDLLVDAGASVPEWISARCTTLPPLHREVLELLAGPDAERGLTLMALGRHTRKHVEVLKSVLAELRRAKLVCKVKDGRRDVHLSAARAEARFAREQADAEAALRELARAAHGDVVEVARGGAER